MCVELVEKGYERYLREHSLEVGFTQAFIAANRDEVEEFLTVRLANPPPLEAFLRIVIARQETDTSGRLKDIRVPTLVMVGDAEGASRRIGHLPRQFVGSSGARNSPARNS